MTGRRTIARAELVRVLRSVGVSSEQIDEIVAHVPDPVDLDRDENLLASYGVTRERLMDWRGSSP